MPRVIEDEVLYDDHAPWPVAADGGGSSLQRMAPVFYGSQAASWSGSDPTPGSVDFSGNLTGDVTGDGIIDAQDIDVLSDVAGSGGAVTYYDLDGNGSVDASDVTFLIQNILGTQAGDANLDGFVDASDFNRWNDAKFDCDGRSWGDGDFTGDGLVDASDFNLWNSARFTGNGLAARAADADGNSRVPKAPQAQLFAAAATMPRLPIRADEPVWSRARRGSPDPAENTDRTSPAVLEDFRWGEWPGQKSGDSSLRISSKSAVNALRLSSLDVSTFDLPTRWAAAPRDRVTALRVDPAVSDRDRAGQDSVDAALASEVNWHDVVDKVIPDGQRRRLSF
jgi:hypothetical protein